MRYLPEMLIMMVYDIVKNFWGLLIIIALAYVYEVYL